MGGWRIGFTSEVGRVVSGPLPEETIGVTQGPYMVMELNWDWLHSRQRHFSSDTEVIV